MPTTPYSDEQYSKEFLANPKLNEKALERALDIRKFEIDLYWKRATYFWAFIAAALAGFVAVQASSASNKVDMSVLLANLGIVFSFGWFCVNRGSKFWQENWEYHVDMLEDAINGPLYKVVMSRNDPANGKEWLIHLLTGPSKISVSKVNQLISIFVTLMWVGLLWYSLPPIRPSMPIDWRYVALIALTVATCAGYLFLGKTYTGGYWHSAMKRSAKIKDDHT